VKHLKTQQQLNESFDQNMDIFNNLLEKLNSVNITPTSVDCWEEDIIDYSYNFFKENFEDENGNPIYKFITQDELYSDRYHSIGISIIKIHDKYLGITHITDCSGHRSVYEYLNKIKFQEMKKSGTKDVFI
jgi:hypothetical protein